MSSPCHAPRKPHVLPAAGRIGESCLEEILLSGSVARSGVIKELSLTEASLPALPHQGKMLCGTYRCPISRDGEIRLPRPLLKGLPQQTIFCALDSLEAGVNGSLVAFPEVEFAWIRQALTQLMGEQCGHATVTQKFSPTSIQGARLVIPEGPLRDVIMPTRGATREVVLTGYNSYFGIWNAAHFDATAPLREKRLAEVLEYLGL